MLDQSRRKWALVGGSLLLWVMIGYVWAGKPEGPKKARIISPPDEAVLLSGNLDIIAESPHGRIELDGKPCQCEPFASPLCVAHVWLDPGMHELRVGDQRSQFVVALNEMEHDGPRDWKIYRFHDLEPDDRRCGACHVVQLEGDVTRVTGLPTDDICMKCHEASEMRAIESHQVQPRQACRTCHAIHGAPIKMLLKPSATGQPG